MVKTVNINDVQEEPRKTVIRIIKVILSQGKGGGNTGDIFFSIDFCEMFGIFSNENICFIVKQR